MNENRRKGYWNGNDQDPGGIYRLIKYNSLTDPEFYPEVPEKYIAGLTIFNDIGNQTVGKGITEYNIVDQLDDRKFYALDNENECSFSYDNLSDYSMMMDYEKVSYFANVENGKSTTMKPSGYINLKGDIKGDIKGDNKITNYSLTMMTNNSEDKSDRYSITVSGNNTNNVTLKKHNNGYKNGYILSSDNLQNIKLKAEKGDIKAEKTLSTPYKFVFIYKIGENTIGIDELTGYKIGNVDYDDDVSVKDVTAIQKDLARIEKLEDEKLVLADTNGDGQVDINDATHIQKYLAGLVVDLGKA